MFSTHSTPVDSSGILSVAFRTPHKLPFPHKRDADKLERIQKATTTMVSWLEDTKSKERLRGAGLFHL